MRARSLLLLPLLYPLITASNCTIGEPLTASSSNNPLSPAAALIGTWKTAAAVSMKTQTDICGSRVTFGTMNWSVTWIVTAVQGNANQINVEMRLAQSGISPVAPAPCQSPGVGYVPQVSPSFLTLDVSSSAFSTPKRNDGVSVSGSFTSSNIAGTYVHWECLLVCFGEFSDAQKFILVKQ